MYDVGGVHARTNKKIGAGHVDNKKGHIHLTKISNETVEKLSKVKGKLLRIVDDLENSIKATMAK